MAGGYQVLHGGEVPRNGMMLNIGVTATMNYLFVARR